MKIGSEAAERVARALLSAGQATANDLAVHLEMTPAGVRRQLASLVEDGLALAHDKAAYGPSPKRGRGRPSVMFALTDAGRAACDQAYDDLALSALRFIADQFGPQAVERFAADRARRLASTALTDASAAPVTPEQLAATLSHAGYAAQVEPLGEVAVQLCQHNCPVVDAAREFPVLCEAETAELGRALGRHVTRLATLAHGDEVCTAVFASVASAAPITDRKVSA